MREASGSHVRARRKPENIGRPMCECEALRKYLRLDSMTSSRASSTHRGYCCGEKAGAARALEAGGGPEACRRQACYGATAGNLRATWRNDRQLVIALDNY